MAELNSKIPKGQLAEKWTHYKAHTNLVNPANKRRLEVIVVGTGLAGASAAASLAEMGFKVKNYCYQDSPRRAHSIAAQGGLMPPRTIRTTATVFTVCFTIPSREVTTVPAKPMCIAWPKSATPSLTNVWHRECPLPANMADCSTTVLSEVLRFPVLSMHGVRPVSSCCWEPTVPLAVR